MSLMKTKPKWCQFAAASEQGWINSKTGELLVSMRGLKSKLETETQLQVKEEIIMQVQEEVKTEIEPVQIQEETIKKPKKKQKLLGEVVEFTVTPDQEVIGE